MRVTRSRSVLLGTLVLALTLTGCGGGDDGEKATEAQPDGSAAEALAFGVDDEAVGPAPAIEGAVPGGTIRVLDSADLAHLDPARIYVNTQGMVSNLITRTLTGYRQAGGKVTLVGDLATNTGVTKDGGKTWTYTLREGITWEDGSPITAAQVKYGMERLFVADYAEGPVYLQEWLTGTADFRKVYAGPYGGKSFKGILAPDDRTVVLKFPKPQPDVPFAVAMTVSAPVKPSEDTKAKYDQRPFASGPYRIGERKIDKSLTLVRNENWKPESDPIRYQYPDTYEFEWGDQRLAQYQRIIAGNGRDATALALLDNVAPELLAEVSSDPALMERTVSGATPYTFYFTINTKRVTELAVRKAMYEAWPREQIRQIGGGPIIGDIATTISPSTLVGHEPDDVLDVPPTGDPARARATLEAAGKVGTKIVHAYRRTDTLEKQAVAIAQVLEEAGFEVVSKPLSEKNYYDEVGKLNNSFDVFQTGWGFDWPSGSTVYPPLMDGRKIAEQGTNYAQFNDKAVNAEIDRILTLTDPVAAGKAWAALDRKLMEQVATIPYRYDKAFQMFGPRVGGAELDSIFGIVDLNGLYVKPE